MGLRDRNSPLSYLRGYEAVFAGGDKYSTETQDRQW
jgi:hypothetical protein